MENGGQDKENRSNPEPVAGERRAEVVKVPVEFAIEEVKSDAIESEKTWAGIKFCYIIIGLIGLESVIMILYFVFATYSLKSLVQPLTTESVEIFKEARAAIVDDILRISNLFLGSILLPILTLLLGYIYGARSKRLDSEEEGD